MSLEPSDEKALIDAIAFCIETFDGVEERRLPPGTQVREKVSTLPEFQSAYVSPTWNDQKRDAMDKRTLHKRPVHIVSRHDRGWMFVHKPETPDAEYMVNPGAWEKIE